MKNLATIPLLVRAACALSVLASFGAAQLSTAGNQLWWQSPWIQEEIAANDSFGSVFAVGDFDADGMDDLAIGVPNEAVGSVEKAGVVHVLYGSSMALTPVGNQLWYVGSGGGLPGLAEANDRLGYGLAAGDFNGDGADDLAIGIPGKRVGSELAAGAMRLIYGVVGAGLANGTGYWYQGFVPGSDSPEAGDEYGERLVAGDFDGDGIDDLVVAAAHESFGVSRLAVALAGAVHVYFGAAGVGLGGAGAQFLHQQTPGIPGSHAALDYFGHKLAVGDFDDDGVDDLVVGVATKDVFGVQDAGWIVLVPGLQGSGLDPFGAFEMNQTQLGNSPQTNDSFGDSLAVGDFNQDQVDDLAVGVPGETVGRQFRAGAVHVVFGAAGSGLTAAGSQFWFQGGNGLQGQFAADNRFGWALAAGDFDGDGADDLAVSAPEQLVGGATKAGVAHVIYGALGVGLTGAGDQMFSQNAVGSEDSAEAFDYYGFSLAAGDFDGNGEADLVIGVPSENHEPTSTLNVGAVAVLYAQ